MTVESRTGSIQLRDATPDDVRAMARVHRMAYSAGHFLAVLPERALADYYARFLGNGSQAVLAIPGGGAGRPGGDVLGFAVFGQNIEPRIAAFKRDQRMAILRAAIAHPLLAARKVAVRAAVGRDAPHHAPAPALLLSIAVAEAGKGVGRMLLESMLQRCVAAGEVRVGLYVRHNNVTAINAYLRAGFRIVESIADQFYMERALGAAPT